MGIKEDFKEFEKEIYKRNEEDTYYKYCVIDFDKLKQYEDDLFNLGEYLPCLLIKCSSIEYFKKMEDLNCWDKVLEEFRKHRNQGRKEDVLEFKEWVDNHKEYSDLLNIEEWDKLNEELKIVDNVFKP